MLGQQTMYKFFGDFVVRYSSVELLLSYLTLNSAKRHQNSSSSEQYDINKAGKIEQGISLADIYRKIVQMHKENNDCRKSIEFLSNKFDDLIKTVHEVKAKNVNLKKICNEYQQEEQQRIATENRLTELECSLEELEIYS